jgi:hypothetical protein
MTKLAAATRSIVIERETAGTACPFSVSGHTAANVTSCFAKQ